MAYHPGEKPTGAQLHALQQLILSREKDNTIAGAWMALATIAPHQAFAKALRDLILLKDVTFSPSPETGQLMTVPAAELTPTGHGATPIKQR